MCHTQGSRANSTIGNNIRMPKLGAVTMSDVMHEWPDDYKAPTRPLHIGLQRMLNCGIVCKLCNTAYLSPLASPALKPPGIVIEYLLRRYNTKHRGDIPHGILSISIHRIVRRAYPDYSISIMTIPTMPRSLSK